jgi:hypothetical protein
LRVRFRTSSFIAGATPWTTLEQEWRNDALINADKELHDALSEVRDADERDLNKNVFRKPLQAVISGG